ncbi:hypothetical protein AB0420_02425 [Streptomyces caelestis]|uniref:hypothetical protein n=1 Tax=Streptomyces caelestis TaxID=36816 RepID=UPI00344E00BA
MPMIVDPAAPQITPPDRVVSPDGWLAALVDELWAGVALSYNGTAQPTARNLVLNPSAEGGPAFTETYSAVTRSLVTGDAPFGNTAWQHVQGSGGTFGGTAWLLSGPQPEGTRLRVSVYVKVPGTGGTTIFFAGRSSTEGTIGVVSAGTPAAGQWTRVTAEYVVPAGKTVDRVAVAYNASAGTTWLADAMMVEVDVDAASAYVDGDQPGCQWEGAPHASPSVRTTALPGVDDVRQVRIMRQDPGTTGPVPVRSADPAWAIEGVGTAYDHEMPLGVAVVYTATPVYADGSTGPSSSLAVTVPAPEPGEDRDLWIKSLDEPGLSMRAMIVDYQGPTSAARQDTAEVPGSPYVAVAYDEHAAEVVQVVVDVPPEDVNRMRALLRSGVLLAQARPGYYMPDAHHVPADITGPTRTGKLGSSEGYRFGWTITPVARPDTAEQPLRVPGWSWDTLADRFASWDAVAASYSSWASLSTNGVT